MKIEKRSDVMVGLLRKTLICMWNGRRFIIDTDILSSRVQLKNQWDTKETTNNLENLTLQQ